MESRAVPAPMFAPGLFSTLARVSDASFSASLELFGLLRGIEENALLASHLPGVAVKEILQPHLTGNACPPFQVL